MYSVFVCFSVDLFYKI